MSNIHSPPYLRVVLPLCVVAALAAAWTAAAADAVPADVIKTRQQALKALGDTTRFIRDQLRERPDVERVKTAAADIKRAADALSGWFPVGTGPETGVKTDARAEIWRDAAGFAAASRNFSQQAARLVQATDSGDTTVLSGSFKSLAQSCKGCHDDYRAKRLDF